jgi:hypothetical protein
MNTLETDLEAGPISVSETIRLPHGGGVVDGWAAASAAELSARWDGCGNSFQVDLHVDGGQSPFDLAIIGEWEWDEFVAFVAKIDQRISQQRQQFYTKRGA